MHLAVLPHADNIDALPRLGNSKVLAVQLLHVNDVAKLLLRFLDALEDAGELFGHEGRDVLEDGQAGPFVLYELHALLDQVPRAALAADALLFAASREVLARRGPHVHVGVSLLRGRTLQYVRERVRRLVVLLDD
eukprot:9490592-Pyramimonas_sp.AAC.3